MFSSHNTNTTSQYQTDCQPSNTNLYNLQHHQHHHHHQLHYAELPHVTPGLSKKERRRTENLNSAYNNLRDCLPNVPSDTKLTKIKTLKLATSYIDYLISILDSQDSHLREFRPSLFVTAARKYRKKTRAGNQEDLLPSCDGTEKISA